MDLANQPRGGVTLVHLPEIGIKVRRRAFYMCNTLGHIWKNIYPIKAPVVCSKNDEELKVCISSLKKRASGVTFSRRVLLLFGGEKPVNPKSISEVPIYSEWHFS